MKTYRAFFIVTKIYGIVVTALLLLIIGLETTGLISERGLTDLPEVGGHLINWYDSPTGFFFTYLVGYFVTWWKKLPGAITIIAACLIATTVNSDNPGWFIFTLPTFLVGLLYLIYWLLIREASVHL